NAQADTFTLNGGTLTGAIDGAGGTDTLTGGNVANAFVVTAANGGTATGVGAGFSNVESLTGNAQNDTFTLNGGTLAGAIDGVGGTNSLIAGNVATTFVLTATNAGTATGVGGFANINNLTGGAQNDTFTLGAALTGAVQGLGGNDVIQINTGGSAASIDGGLGTDQVSYAGSAGPVTIAVTTHTSIENLVGSASGADVLQGTTAADTFASTAAAAGTVAGVTFSSFENLQGLDGNDTFNIGHAFAGVDGGLGTDILDFSSSATARNVTLASTVAAGFSGTAVGGADTFAGIDDLRAGASTTDSLTGLNAASTWTLGAALSYASGGSTLPLAGFEVLTGGSAVDTFNVNASSTATLNGGAGNDLFVFANNVTAGVVDGGAGTDVLDLSAYQTARNVVLTAAGGTDGFNGTEASVTQGFRNVDDVRGSTTAADVITGLAGAAQWLLAGNTGSTYTSGGRTLAFSSFSTVNGGSGADGFRFGAGTQSGNFAVTGGAGDTADVVGAFTVSGGNLTLTNVQTITDSSGAVVTAGTLTITGATGGVGSTSAPLKTNVNAANIQGGAVVLEEQSGSVTLDIDSGTAAANVRVVAGDAVLGLLKGSGVTVVTSAGSIVHSGAATQANIAAGSASLTAVGGSVGTSGQAIVFTAPATSAGITLDINAGTTVNASVTGNATLGQIKGNSVTVAALGGDLVHDGDSDVKAATDATLNASGFVGRDDSSPVVVEASATGLITVSAGQRYSIDNVNNTLVSATGAGTSVSAKVNKAIAAGVGSVSAADDLVTIDWAGLDPNVALVDCLQPCVQLPADQSEDPGLAQIREATKFLLIRTDSGWKMIPVFPREAIAAN
ncbi:MAG TPA: hypothetical protein VE907_16245, partial [Gammaproteobacteria bacterium]|nr:hypothetical protein [Gammaproteobacteria bacterium]